MTSEAPPKPSRQVSQAPDPISPIQGGRSGPSAKPWGQIPPDLITSHEIYRPPLVRERPTYDTPPVPSDFLPLVPEAVDTVGNKYVEGWTGAEVLARRSGPRPIGPRIVSWPLLPNGERLMLGTRWEVPGPRPQFWVNEPPYFSELSEAEKAWAKTSAATLADFDDEAARWKRLDVAVKMLLQWLLDGKVAVSIIDEKTGSAWPMIQAGWSTDAAVRFLELGQDLKRWQKPSFGAFRCTVDGHKKLVTGHVIVSKPDLLRMLGEANATETQGAVEVSATKPLGNRERDTLLIVIAALLKSLKVDISHPTTAAGNIVTKVKTTTAVDISVSTVENVVKKIPSAIERRISDPIGHQGN